jgi:hypothetical protein
VTSVFKDTSLDQQHLALKRSTIQNLLGLKASGSLGNGFVSTVRM